MFGGPSKEFYQLTFNLKSDLIPFLVLVELTIIENLKDVKSLVKTCHVRRALIRDYILFGGPGALFVQRDLINRCYLEGPGPLLL